MIQSVITAFHDRYGPVELLSRAPGRINMIGEHTDYNMGFVLPAAIDRYIIVAASRAEGRKGKIYAMDLNDECDYDIQDLRPTGTWADYILGVLKELRPLHQADTSLNMVVAGNIPQGAGLSSSAALECAAIISAASLLDIEMDRITMARKALHAERKFVGLDCGIMDQYASMFGEKDHFLLIDCLTETHRSCVFDIGDHSLLLVNSNVHHSLADSAYNERRRQCEAGVAAVRKVYGHVRYLREVSIDMLNKVKEDIDPVIYNRCAYVIRENQRVLEMVEALEKKNLDSAGKLMFAAHDDMKINYEITCAETDFIVEKAAESGRVAGARQMGGGFGGCVLHLLHKEHETEYMEIIANDYKNKFGHAPSFIPVSTADAAEIIENNGR